MVEFVSRKNWGLRPSRPPEPARKSYAQRADDLANAINRIALSNHDPFSFHAARDEAARTARALSMSLAADGI